MVTDQGFRSVIIELKVRVKNKHKETGKQIVTNWIPFVNGLYDAGG